MEKIDILIWAIGGGFAGTWAMMFYVARSITQRFDNRIDGLEKRIDGLEKRMDRFEEKLTDIDRRLCRLEGAFSNKECCMITDHRGHQEKSVE